MASLADQFEGWVRRLMPSGVGLETQRRARVMVALAAIMNAAVFVGAPLDLAHHAWNAATIQIVGVIVVDLALVYALRRGTVTAVGHFTSGMLVVLLTLIARSKGGLLATELAWECAAIVFAVLVVGPRGAFVWTLVAGAGLVVHVRSFDAATWQGKALALAGPVDYAIDLGILYLATWGLAYAFDSARAEFFRRLEKRNDEMQRVLEHARDALLTIDREGRIGAERSKRADELLDHPAAGAFLWDVLASDPENALRVPWLQLSWEAILDDVLPREVALDQMPSRVVLHGRTLDLSVTVIEERGVVEGALVVLHDVTDELARERAEQARREILAVFEHVRTDPTAVVDFAKEMNRLVASVSDGTDDAVVKRDLHTIKGSAALFGAESIATLCHAIEERCAQSASGPTPADRALLAQRWSALSSELGAWGGAFHGDQHLYVTRPELGELRAAITAGASPDVTLALLESWELTPLVRVLSRLARQGQTLASKLGKEVDIQVSVDPPTLRVDAEPFAPVFSSLLHAIRNAIDHGIATPDERVAMGKPRRGVIVLSATARDDGVLVLETRDDGEGVAWELVRAKAQALGLPATTEDELARVLMSDGFSTRAEASSISGRGVGLAAVRHAAEDLGGSLRLVSERSKGSRLRLQLPLVKAAA